MCLKSMFSSDDKDLNCYIIVTLSVQELQQCSSEAGHIMGSKVNRQTIPLILA